MTLQGFVWNTSKCSAECSDVLSDNISQRQLLVRPVRTHGIGYDNPNSDGIFNIHLVQIVMHGKT